ncbi:MAG: 3-hydroxybutyryl-CoA dehydrogenase [Paraburkholderia sp.]|jgi:hypothetical protein|nr:3-hydroxybutyryl-CoA dehydrogenase [Paraburkholderia sp.]
MTDMARRSSDAVTGHTPSMINPHGAQGFYDYAHVDVPAYLHQRLGEFGRLLDSSGLFPAFNAAVKG